MVVRIWVCEVCVCMCERWRTVCMCSGETSPLCLLFCEPGANSSDMNLLFFLSQWQQRAERAPSTFNPTYRLNTMTQYFMLPHNKTLKLPEQLFMSFLQGLKTFQVLFSECVAVNTGGKKAENLFSCSSSHRKQLLFENTQKRKVITPFIQNLHEIHGTRQ